MVYRGNLYTSFVTFAKIVLPLAAIVLLASLFLLSSQPEETQRIPYSDVELAEIVSGQRLAEPRYQGVLFDGAPLSVTAQRAIPDPVVEGRITATDIVIETQALDGTDTIMIAPRGVFDETEQIGAVQGGVVINRSDGYVALTPGLRGTITGDRIETLGPLSVTGPGVKLEAGYGRLTQDPAQPRSEVLVFTGGVKLVYDRNAALAGE